MRRAPKWTAADMVEAAVFVGAVAAVEAVAGRVSGANPAGKLSAAARLLSLSSTQDSERGTRP